MAKKKVKTSARKTAKATKRKVQPATKQPTKPSLKKGSKKAPQPKDQPSLGRPKVTGEEQLFMLFHEDFHARQIFDFLRVHTVKELEQYSPQQIVKLLSRPITDTVDRIRRKLAEKNRHLQDDLDFALEYNQRLGG